MIETIINYLNLRIETTGRVVHRHVLTERRKRGGDGVVVPYAYGGSGEFVPVDIGTGSLSWWRGRSGFTYEPISVTGRAVRQRRAVYPLRLLAIIRRENSTADDAFAPSRFAEDLSEAVREDDGDLRNLLLADSAAVRVTSVDFDTPRVWREEFETPVDDLNYSMCMVAIDINVEVVGNPSCWQSECDREADILRLFNFCDASVIARLTSEQVECLEAALCEPTPCDPVTFTINGTEVGQAPSGEQFDANVTLDGVPSGSWNGVDTWEVESTPCAPATWTLRNSDDAVLATGTIPSGGFDDIPAPDATYTLVDTTSPTPLVLEVGNIPSGAPRVITAPPATVTRDGLPFGTVPSGGAIDVPSNCAPPFVPYIGGRALRTAGDHVTFAKGQIDIPNGRMNTYGFGFMLRHAGEAGNRGILDFGMTTQPNSATYFNRRAIGVWSNGASLFFALQAFSNNAVAIVTFPANVNHHIYLQFATGTQGTNFGLWWNGVLNFVGGNWPNMVQGTNYFPLVDGSLWLGCSLTQSTSRAVHLWDVMLTDGTLTPAEITAMANASIGGTDPRVPIGAKAVELIDVGQTALGVPSSNYFAPTELIGINRGSRISCSGAFTSPHGIVAIP